MPGLNRDKEEHGASPFPRLAEAVIDDHALSVAWSPGSTHLAALPSEGRPVVLQPGSDTLIHLRAHRGGNGTAAWHPQRPVLATFGQDRVVHLYEPPFGEPVHTFEIAERGWAERLAWNADGSLLAVAVGRSVLVLEAATGEARATFPNHKSTVSDLAWNPARIDELAIVCDGGVRLWRVGHHESVGAFDWGGASLKISWSPDARWIVTGDQTPSVHVYEVATDTPLHIQGFGGKAKAFAWQGTGDWLAIASGPLVTVWPCTGKQGPNGARPIPLEAHHAEVTAIEFLNDEGLLLTAGRDGVALLWQTHQSNQPALLLHQAKGFTTTSLAPGTNHLATGDEAGNVIIWNLVVQCSELPE